RRLARAGGAADEQDHGQIELAELGELAQAAHRVERLLLAEGLDRELLYPFELERLLPALDEVLVDPARELVGADARHTHGDERAGHQALRVRLLLGPERERLDVPALVHARAPAGTSRCNSASSSAHTTSFVASTTCTPRSAAASATTSIAAAFSSTRYTSASMRARS